MSPPEDVVTKAQAPMSAPKSAGRIAIKALFAFIR